MNWRSRPLTSHEVIVSLIANTRAGLTVAAELDHGKYPKGVKITDREMRDLEQSCRLRRHDWHPESNYCLSPVNPPQHQIVPTAGSSVLWLFSRQRARHWWQTGRFVLIGRLAAARVAAR